MSLHYLSQDLRRAGSNSGSSLLASAHLLSHFLSCFPKLCRVPAVEDLAFRILKAFPRGRISAQDVLVHGFFSPLPPQLYQVPAGKLTQFHLTKSYFTCYLLWVSCYFKSLCHSPGHLPALPPHSCVLQSLHPVANLSASFSVFFHLTTVLTLKGDMDGLPPWYI